MMKISVIVATYNQKVETILLTLQSVVKQQCDSFEIIIADDCSKDNHFEVLREYFEKIGFENYYLLAQEKNVGTVKNFLAALKIAKGEYVRNLGAGDLLYDEKILDDLYNHMKENHLKYCFTPLKQYYLEGDHCVIRDFYRPMDLDAYRKKNFKRTKRNIICYGVDVYGMAIVYEKELFIKYLERMENEVIYCEDLIGVRYVLDGIPISLYDRYGAYYECASGVSNNHSSKMKMTLQKDIDRFFELCYEDYPNDECLKIKRKYAYLNVVSNLYVRTIIRFFVNPDALRHILSHYWQRLQGHYKLKEQEYGFLDRKDFIPEWKRLGGK